MLADMAVELTPPSMSPACVGANVVESGSLSRGCDLDHCGDREVVRVLILIP